MCDILRPSHWHVRVALCIEEEENIIRRMNSIVFIFRLTCDSWIPPLRASGSDLGWDLGFELGL